MQYVITVSDQNDWCTKALRFARIVRQRNQEASLITSCENRLAVSGTCALYEMALMCDEAVFTGTGRLTGLLSRKRWFICTALWFSDYYLCYEMPMGRLVWVIFWRVRNWVYRRTARRWFDYRLSWFKISWRYYAHRYYRPDFCSDGSILQPDAQLALLGYTIMK